ncbi:uncharacterized protein LOC124342020 isoform X1 [Daphnia pulicaria]|uniref:uncharacterized protein LOC124313438 isoform X1 n=1 Tax=Daphnia pulicaria TaxID=35523 RepID=UPI001EE9B41E|nr:uncharacterized protein LOC124313438 isoform X1 [Daphnia pulicaria]XP_046634318.1 uncharacterized protein LOC124313438 isoform X1 [Daphnia pulicaria]XP_046634319.1 uncharacterized protein LOC124313438 isoform X1 [Daphnia pulicaria]XP_046634320.1 uncharacterized protein LOC124313438 isoform X1 [Daphnia pulicaria]XP_046634322.1 uncharacterized protein LOC124313438 isoform X1 [Daphnia pulicaria]XP_046634323.1 uncharacterized protein LOC124313438 isoform X1 [Daphnia pulicaria]XP_046650939.1 un
MDESDYNNETGCHRRKRQLSDGDPDACDFMPLSKRINNLHLNGSNLNSEATPSYTPTGSSICECRLQPSTSSSVIQCSLCNPNLYGITRQALPLPDLLNIPNEMSRERTPQHQQFIHDDTYSPDMDVHSNPHYYTPNKLLFDLHIERVKRHGILFKPNKYDG